MKTDKLQKAITYLTESHNAEWAECYGEPGYGQPEKGVILADWNNIPKGLADWLEKCGYKLEWSDEWAIVYSGAQSKAYRTQPDSYSWEPSLILSDDGEYISPDDGADCAIDECAMSDQAHPCRLLPHWVTENDLIEAGFVRVAEHQESGHHPGQTDEPAPIAKAQFDNGASRVVFKRIESSQFYSVWDAWAQFETADEGATE